jgi:hypothetical protein
LRISTLLCTCNKPPASADFADCRSLLASHALSSIVIANVFLKLWCRQIPGSWEVTRGLFARCRWTVTLRSVSPLIVTIVEVTVPPQPQARLPYLRKTGGVNPAHVFTIVARSAPIRHQVAGIGPSLVRWASREAVEVRDTAHTGEDVLRGESTRPTNVMLF